jgi:hypothetical protein
MVDQKTDQSKYNDPDDQITDRTGRKILQQIVQQIKENNAAQVVIAAITGFSVKDDKNIPIAINTHPSRKKARMDE